MVAAAEDDPLDPNHGAGDAAEDHIVSHDRHTLLVPDMGVANLPGGGDAVRQFGRLDEFG